MRKIVKIVLCLLGFSLYLHSANSPHVVMLSFLSYPEQDATSYENTIEGIPATYFGYRSISDHIGLTTFWYHGDKSLVYVLVCNQIEPVMLCHNTLDYWKVSDKAAHEFYILEKKYDAALQLYFWDIQKILMQGTRIPLNTIVIHVDPKEVYVPTGVVISSNNLQLVLPTIYVKKINLAENMFRFATISQFFSRMNQAYNISHDDLRVNP